MQIAVQIIEIVDPVKHADLQQRLVQEAIGIAPGRVTARVKPQLGPFALNLLELLVPQIEMAQLGDIYVQLAEELGFDRFDASNARRDLVHAFDQRGIALLVMYERLIRDADEKAILPLPATNHLLPLRQTAQTGLVRHDSAARIRDVRCPPAHRMQVYPADAGPESSLGIAFEPAGVVEVTLLVVAGFLNQSEGCLNVRLAVFDKE